MNRIGCFFVLCVLLSGCMGLAPQPSVCTTIPAGSHSVICQVADAMHTSPEEVAAVLKLSNAGALATDAYAAGKAHEFVQSLQQAVEVGRKANITFQDLVSYINRRWLELPPRVMVLFVVVEELTTPAVDLSGITEYLSPFDFDMLASHLDEQARIISLFVKQ